MPKATTFRLVNTLQESGFLMRLESNRYCLSLKLLRLAGLVRNTIGIRDVARPIMLRCPRRRRDDHAQHPLRLRAHLHRRRRHPCIPDDDRATWRARQPALRSNCSAPARLSGGRGIDEVIAKAPAGLAVNAAAVKKELATIRRQGWARTSGQRVAGVTAIAVPLSDDRDEVRYSLALTGPSVRVDPRRDEFMEIMLEAGRQISLLMGGTYPPPRGSRPPADDPGPPSRAGRRAPQAAGR